MQAMRLDQHDVAIIVSYSGNNASVEPLNIVPYLRENNVPLIGITSGGDNLLRQSTDTILTMCSRERLYTKVANFSTEESLNYVFNVLFASVFERQYEKKRRVPPAQRKTARTRAPQKHRSQRMIGVFFAKFRQKTALKSFS